MKEKDKIKKLIEEVLGYQIIDYKLNKVYDKNILVGVNVTVIPQTKVEFIDVNITLNSEGFN